MRSTAVLISYRDTHTVSYHRSQPHAGPIPSKVSGGSGGGGGPGGPDPPPFGPRCRLFNIGPKVGPPPFLLVDLRCSGGSCG